MSETACLLSGETTPIAGDMARLAALELERRQAKPEPFRAFVSRVAPRYRWYGFGEHLAERLQRVADGDCPRLLVMAPPRHGKSELLSRLLPAYYLSRYPQRWVGLASYAAELAYDLSRAARANYREAGGALSREAAGVTHWETTRGGGMWAAGVGGPITGKGMHLGIIDDPVKNAQEAASSTIRRKAWEWYGSTWYTREEPGGAMVVVMTRWHEDDLVGRLLEDEASDDPEGWEVVNLEALAPETGDPLGRKPGEALVPARYPVAKLDKIRRRIGSYYWSALYCGRPTPPEGNLFKREWFEVIDASEVPSGVRRCRGWDEAATEGGGDFTVGARVAKNGTVFYIEDVRRAQLSPGSRDRMIRSTAQDDGYEVEQFGQQDPGAAGKGRAAEFRRMLTGFSVSTLPATGDKTLRADALRAAAEDGRVKVVRGPWNREFFDELLAFPYGAHDDQVDAAAWAFNRLARGEGWFSG